MTRKTRRTADGSTSSTYGRWQVKKPKPLPAYLAPEECRTNRELCALIRENIETPNGWILVSESHVTVARQRAGHPNEGMVSLPHKEFAKLARWFLTPQKIKGSKRAVPKSGGGQ